MDSRYPNPVKSRNIVSLDLTETGGNIWVEFEKRVAKIKLKLGKDV